MPTRSIAPDAIRTSGPRHVMPRQCPMTAVAARITVPAGLDSHRAPLAVDRGDAR
jgi:hypothetical protein